MTTHSIASLGARGHLPLSVRADSVSLFDWEFDARDESGGLIDMVTDRQILSAYKLLAAGEGVFVEPASAAGVAGLLAKAEAGQVDPGQTIVCTVTGNGLKDPQWAISGAPAPVRIGVDAHDAAAELGLI